MAKIDGLKGFRTLGPADREVIAAATREIVVGKGRTVFSEGRPADSLWAVKGGLVHIVKSGPDGREMVIEVIPPGELFGAVVALENRPYPASALTAEPSVLWRMPASIARELCRKYPSLRVTILEQVTGRLREAHERLRSVALERVEQRLARMLLSLAQKIGQSNKSGIFLNITRQELADMVGTTVETTIRITRKWQAEGLIRALRHELRLTDPDGLRKIARGS